MDTPVPPSAQAQPAWNLGDIVVRRVDEITLPPQTGPWLLPGATAQVIDEASWPRPHIAGTDTLRLSSHTFAVEADGTRTLLMGTHLNLSPSGETSQTTVLVTGEWVSGCDVQP